MYEANYLPQQLPASELSMVLYAFANLSANGTVYVEYTWALAIWNFIFGLLIIALQLRGRLMG